MKPWFLAVLLLAALPLRAAETVPLDNWQGLLQARAGKPFVVHFWGVTCGPCQVELPAWGKFHRDHPDLAFILVEVDPLPVKPARLAVLLDKAGLGGVTSLSLIDPDERTLYDIDRDWAGELPMTLMIGSRGQTVRSVGAADFAALQRWWARQGDNFAKPAPG